MAGTLFAYSLAVSAVLMVVWGCCDLWRGGTAALRRRMLLAGYAIALAALPLTLPHSIAIADPVQTSPATAATAPANDATLPAAEQSGSSHAATNPLQVLLTLYIIGVAAVAAMTLRDAARIARLRRHTEKQIYKGWSVYVSERDDVAPFSFGRFMVIGRKDSGNNAIMEHEASHLRHRHSADMLLAQTVATLCWYCPAAWALRRRLQLEHEFQADRDVVESGTGVREYSLLLVSRAAAQQSEIAHGLGHTDLKRRIAMLTRPNKVSGRLKALLPTASLGAAMILCAIPQVGSALDAVRQTRLSAEIADAHELHRTVVYGSTVPADGKFIDIADYEQSSTTFDEVEGIVLPKAGAVIISRQETIKRLAPGVRKFLVNGTMMGPKEFYGSSHGYIHKVSISGRVAIVHTGSFVRDRYENCVQNAINANK